jgi:glycosyltransferase involved in cell wall biosynthesis
MRHIVHLTTVHRPFDTRIFQKECRTLAKEGYRVSLVAPHSTQQVVEGVEVMPIPGLNDRLARAARFTRGTWGVYLVARRLGADVYHFHDPELMPVGLLLKVMTPACVVYDVHENYPQNMLAKEWLPSWARALAHWGVAQLERIVVDCVDAVVTTTAYIASRFPSSKATVIRNYPLLSILQQPSNSRRSYEDNYTLIYTGGLTDHRGVYQIIQALEYVKNPQVQFIVLGGHVDRQTEARVRSSPGWSRVDYRGQAPYQEMYRCLQSAAVGLVCNQPVYSYDHALPNKLFEYMAAGLPVIASDFDLWREIVKDNECGVTVDPTSPRQIAEAIDYLLEHPELRRVMGQNGRQAIQQRYNWANESLKLLQLYKEVLRQC